MTALTTSARFDRGFLLRLADRLALAVAIVLPWSTSATAISVAAWAVVVLPTLDAASVRPELGTAAGGLPVLLWLFGAIGMLWADVGWGERLAGLGGFNRLLLVPLLLAHFRRSEHGDRVIYGFLASSAAVLHRVLFPGVGARSGVARIATLVKPRSALSYGFSTPPPNQDAGNAPRPHPACARSDVTRKAVYVPAPRKQGKFGAAGTNSERCDKYCR